MIDDTGVTPVPEFDLEARLRQALAAKAGDAPVGGADWGDLSARLAWATRRRQRVLAGAAGVALLVGAAGGYFGEAAASPGPLAARAGGSASATRGGPSSGADRALAPSPSGLASPQLCPGATGGSSGTEVGTANRVFIRTTTDGVTIRVYQMPSSGVPCVEPPTPLAGTGGTASSGSASASSGSAGSSGTTGSPPSSIMQIVPVSPEVTVELSDGDAVGQGAIASPECLVQPGLSITNGSGATGGAVLPPASPTPVDTTPTTTPTPTTTTVTPATTTPPSDTTTTTTTSTPTTTTTPPSEPQQLTTGSFGVQEGDPVWWVAVEVDSSVTSVRMTFPGGSSDQMAPVNGIAVLAGRVAPTVAAGGPGPYVVRGTLDLLGADGSVLKTVTLPEEPVPVPSPAPVPLQGGAAQGAPTVTPGAIIACPQAATATPQGQSSATTEKR
jgi:hypothetical protein